MSNFVTDYAPGTRYEHSVELIMASLSVILKVSAGMGLPVTAEAIALVSKSVALGQQEGLIEVMRRFVATKHAELQETVKYETGKGLLASWKPKEGQKPV